MSSRERDEKRKYLGRGKRKEREKKISFSSIFGCRKEKINKGNRLFPFFGFQREWNEK